MRRFAFVLVLVCLSIVHPRIAVAQGAGEPKRLSVEWGTGGSNSIPMPLTISQDGQPDIHISGAHYDTLPFEGSMYYAYRIGLWKGKSAWEFEWVHNKVYLQDNPPEVQLFTITHGYNLLYVNRARTFLYSNPRFSLVRRFGAGAVITHPENIVRNLEHADGGGITHGYYLSGLTGQGSLTGEVHVGRHAFVKIEGKVTGSWVNVPVVNGNATVPTITFHAIAGVGARF